MRTLERLRYSSRAVAETVLETTWPDPLGLVHTSTFLLVWSIRGYFFCHWFSNGAPQELDTALSPPIQLNFDTNCLEWASDLTSWKVRFPKDCSCFSCQSRLGSSGYPLLPVTCLQIHSFPYHFSFVHLLEQLTKSREALSCQLPFSYKGHECTTRWRDTEGKVWKGPQHRCVCPCAHLPAHP